MWCQSTNETPHVAQVFLAWDRTFRVYLRGKAGSGIFCRRCSNGQVHRWLSAQEVFPDHNGVDQYGVLKREESNAARLAVCVPNDGTYVDFSKVRKIVLQALWFLKMHRKT
jgi:hypothetical protein